MCNSCIIKLIHRESCEVVTFYPGSSSAVFHLSLPPNIQQKEHQIPFSSSQGTMRDILQLLGYGFLIPHKHPPTERLGVGGGSY